MKNLLLLALLAFGLTSSARIMDPKGGEQTVRDAVHGIRVDALMKKAGKTGIVQGHNFSWQILYKIEDKLRTVQLWTETSNELDYVADYFTDNGYTFGCPEILSNGFTILGGIDEDEKDAFDIMANDADEEFTFAPKGYFVNSGI